MSDDAMTVTVNNGEGRVNVERDASKRDCVICLIAPESPKSGNDRD